MWSPEDLVNRLLRFKNTGINIDQLKYKIFPKIKPLATPDNNFR